MWLPLLKEMRFILKKDTKQFLLVYMIPQITTQNILHFFFSKVQQ